MQKSYSSFAALGAALGIEQNEKPQRHDTKKCFKCGGEMTRIEGTNVYVCLGKIKNKYGDMVDCPNNTLAKVG